MLVLVWVFVCARERERERERKRDREREREREREKEIVREKDRVEIIMNAETARQRTLENNSTRCSNVLHEMLPSRQRLPVGFMFHN